jgi:hypothetical protein
MALAGCHSVILYRFLSKCIMKIRPKGSDPQLAPVTSWDHIAYFLYWVV